MPPTAEGVFRIIDRATRPMRDMERQAQRTDAAIARLGLTMDALGGNKMIRNMEQTERHLRGISRQERIVTGDTDRMARSFKRVNRETEGLWANVRKLGATLIGLTKIIGLLKLPAIAAGIGVLVQAVGALAGGVVALAPRIADLAGLLAPLPALVTGVAFAVVTAKLAFKDFGEAMGGNKKALERLTPEARRFVNTLKLYKPVLDSLRAAAQGGIFAGLDYALRRVQRGVPVIQGLIARMSGTLGGLARTAADRFTTPSFLRDLTAMGNQGNFIVDRMGRGLLNLLSAVRHLAVAARPFTKWLTDTIFGWTKWAEQQAEISRQSGRFAQFLSRTRQSLTQFGHILRDVWFTFRNIGRAARPLGDSLWKSAERATAGWRKWSDQIGNRVRMTQDFNSMGAAIGQMFGLVGDLGQAIWRMGTSQGLAPLVARLRDLVPTLERILTVMAETFAPAVVEAILALGRTIEHLTGATGPLTVMLNIFTTTLNVVNGLIDRFPVIGGIITAALTVIGINIFIRRVQMLAASWWGVATGASAAARAQGIATGASMVGGGRAAAGAMGAGSRMFPTTAAAGTSAAAVARGGGRVGRAAGFLGAGARAGGKLFLPAALAMGAFDAITAQREGNVGMQGLQTGAAILHGASFGLVPRIKTGSERMNEREKMLLEGGYRQTKGTGFWGAGTPEFGRVQSLPGQLRTRLAEFGGDDPRNRKDVIGQIGVYEQHLRRVNRLQSEPAKAYAEQLRGQLVALKQTNRQLFQQEQQQKRLNEARRAQQSINRADLILNRLGTRFNRDAQTMGYEGAMSQVTARTVALMPGLKPAGRKVLAESVMAWAKEAKRQNPRLTDEFERLQAQILKTWKGSEKNVQQVNGRILRGTKTEWRNIRTALVREAQLARVGLDQNFAAIQARALGSLQAMGFTRAEATGLMRGVTLGGQNAALAGAQIASGQAQYGMPQARARGGRISGIGNRDTVPIAPGNMAAPGELVVNRHQEGVANRMLGMFGHTLGGIVSRVRKPHNLAQGGRIAGIGSGISSIASALLGQFPGLAITSTTGGKHATNSYHYKGMAVDIGGAPEVMHAAAAWVGQQFGRSLLEGIHNPNLSIKNGANVPSSFWGPTTWAGHANHLHLAAGAAAAGAAAGAGMVGALLGNIAVPGTSLRGVPGGLVMGGSHGYARALRERINRGLAQQGAGGGGHPGYTTAGGTYNKAMLARLAASVGVVNPSLAAAVGLAESSGNPNAKNVNADGSIDRGLWQINSIHGALSTFDPLGNARAMASISRGGTNWNPWVAYTTGRHRQFLAGGGRVGFGGWMDRGGSFTARRPMLFGVGERRAEDVTVTPRGRGAGGRPIIFRFEGGIHIDYRGAGDAAQTIEREVRQAVARVAQAIEEGSIVDDQGALR